MFRRTSMAALCMTLTLLVSCEDGSKKAYESGYRAGLEQGLADGQAAGMSKGQTEGSKRGARAADADADSGASWTFYVPTVAISLLVGAFFGIVMQYSILAEARKTQRLPSLAATSLVPGMRSSFAYGLIEKKSRVVADLDAYLLRVQANHLAQIEQIKYVRRVVAKKIEAASTLEEIFADRIIGLAKQELTSIVAEAERTRREGF